MSYLPEKGASVPFSRRLRNCSAQGVSRAVGVDGKRQGQKARYVPLFSTARHSSLVLWSGYDILLEALLVEPKRELRKGMFIDDCRARDFGGAEEGRADARVRARLEKVWKVPSKLEKRGRRMRILKDVGGGGERCAGQLGHDA